MSSKKETASTVKRLVLLAGTAVIQGRIASIQKRAAKLDQEIHLVAVSCLVHAAEHGDVTLMQNLVGALGRSTRKQALIGWSINYGPFKLEDKTGALVYDRSKRAQAMEESNLIAAEQGPFWDFISEKPYAQFDLSKAIAALLRKADHALQSPEQDASLVSPAALAELRKLASVTSPETAVVSL